MRADTRVAEVARDDPAGGGRLPRAARNGPVSMLVSRVARLHRIAAGKLLKDLGLYPGQEFLMMHLWETGPVRQSELIKAVDLDPSTVTKMLQRLEQAGHVRRRPDPEDRRAVLVESTEASCALFTEVRRSWGELEEQTLTGLDPDERAQLARLLARVEANLRTETADCPEAARREAPGQGLGRGLGQGPG